MLNKLVKNHLKSMEHEIKLLESISHPGVIKYIESLQNNKIIYVVMEYFEGKQLFDMIIEKVEDTGKSIF